ncbi:CYTH domain-containing protein [Puteibacter caeruleilacunae]|nr:CYTH domain-containing protein [Puteibacter caeruleilacunae]
MATEIERKFLINHNKSIPFGKGVKMVQAYLCADKSRTVRVRIAGDQGFLTIKGPTQGVSRKEFEYEIPVAEAIELLPLCDAVVEKIRHCISYQGKVWEVDVFSGDNDGLILAEIELSSEDEKFELPEWIGEEVSGDKRYFNSYLSRIPFKNW